jgi:squalene-hopene/tetraprenyl-beta-curcumene cyclase
LIFLIGFAARIGAAEKMPAEVDVRKAIERGLPFVEKDGLAWIKNRNCMSCHTVTYMLWAHNEAAAQGIAVDQKKLAEWTEWSMKKSMTQRVFYKLDRKTIESPPEGIPSKLEKVADQGFTHEKDFVAALAEVLTPEELKQHQADLVKKAAAGKKTEGNDGGGLDTMTQLFLARDRAAKDKKADFYTSTAELIVRLQDANGMWRAGGQLPARRWSKATADQTTTMWTILALSTYDEPTPAIKKSLEKAHAAVKKPAGDGNLEWVVARLIYMHKFGTQDEITAVKEQLLKRQNTDGGWNVLAEAESDAFSTGQSLYALRVVGVAHDDPVILRGQKYLIEKQSEDGSWIVSPALTSNGDANRHKRLEPIWRNWGSSWATIGLAKSLPTK